MNPSTKKKLKTVSGKRLLQLKPFLDEVAARVEVPSYIEKDPVCFMHIYEDREDRLLAGFFAAIMAWGRRDIIINKVGDLMERFGHRPAAFISGYNEAHRDALAGFRHRTFNETDIHHIILVLRAVFDRFGGFEGFWRDVYQQAKRQNRELIAVFHERFFGLHDGPDRVRKHIANSEKNSSCKRLYLYLRWTVRQGSCVDTGLFTFMPPSELMIPLDVHVARHARALGLLGRHQNDWKSVVELTERLRKLNPTDPARFDYALFGIGTEGIQPEDGLLVNKYVE